MAILIPVLRKVKAQAKSIICFNNLRQIGFAANLYAQAYNNCVPRGTGGKRAEETVWFQLFMPFLSEKPPDNDWRNVKMYRCPEYPNKEQVICYVVNSWDFKGKKDIKGEQTTEPTLLTVYKQLSTTIYLADNEYGPWRAIITKSTEEGSQEHVDGWQSSDVWRREHLPITDEEKIRAGIPGWIQSQWLGPRVARKRHRQGFNCLYFDWHVGYVPAEKSVAKTSTGGINYAALDMWRLKK
jgi:prepilin-type processing-associated H-X9-DG protein